METAVTHDRNVGGFYFDGEVPEPILVDGFAPATHVGFEWREYWVSCPGAATIRSSGREVRRLPNDLFLLRFENQIGLARLRAYDAQGRELPGRADLLILSGKIPTLAEHAAFQGRLLEDLFRRISHLPFTVSSPTAQQVDEALHPPTAIFALHFLTHEADRIEQALRIVRRAPHRKLTVEDELVPLHAVTTVDSDALLDLMHAPSRWRSAPRSRSPLALRLDGQLPESIRQSLARETLDTAENRFVLEATRQFMFSLAAVRGQTWWPNVDFPQRTRLTALGRALEEFVANPDWREVGRSSGLPAASRVMQRKDGYRDLFALWERYQRARRPLFAALDAAIQLRDIATLYEYWVFFELVDELSGVLGERPVLSLANDETDGLKWRATARFGSYGTLWYNRSISGYSAANARPDMLWVPGVGRAVAFDAKFRLRETKAGPDIWNNDDLVKMHAYRDSLDVRAAVAIYPGDFSRFWSPDLLTFVPSIRFLIEREIEGIGAINRTPGG